MKDFLKGFLGTLLCWLCGFLGVIAILVGIICASIAPIIIGLILFAVVAGLKYWLGKIVHLR